jgi:hypothetical protein
MGKLLAHLGTQVEQMPDHVMKLVNERLDNYGEEIAKTREEGLGRWEEAITNIVQQEVEVAVETCLKDQREGLIDDIRAECLNDLKGDLESGLVTITLPRYDF